MSIASTYNIELRDKSGDLKGYLTPFVSRLNWEWNRIGGCGACSMTIQKPYRDVSFDAMDDIQIRIPNESFNDEYTDFLSRFAGTDGDTSYDIESGETDTFAGTAQILNRALLLDGNSDYVTANYRQAFGSGDFTIEFDFYPTSKAGGIGQYLEDANRWFVGIDDGAQAGGRLSFYFETGGSQKGYYIKNNAVSLNTWHHIAAVRDGAVGKLFVDGVNINADETTAFGTNTIGSIATNLNMGYVLAMGYLNGSIKNVKISTVARYSDNFTPPMSFPSEMTASKLVYRGYIANATPTLASEQSINLQAKGYFDLLKKIVVNDAGDTKTYASSLEISTIVTSLIDTFVTPKTSITKGTIDAGSFSCDLIQFLTTVDEALNTLAQLASDVEYGVDEDLVFFWRTESEVIRHKFLVGNNVEFLERKVNYDGLVNKAYLLGGTVEGVRYKRTAENTDSQDQYYLSEKIVNNGSIVSDTVADQYLGSILSENAMPKLNVRARIANTVLRIEDTVPLGLIVLYDVDYDRNLLTDSSGDIIGEAADGGSDIVIGETADGGDDIIVGGQYSIQVDRIQYEPSNTPGRMNLTIQCGDTILETAAIIKRIDLALASIQQY